MKNYKIFLELILKRIKNRIIINFRERAGVICAGIVLILLSLVGTLLMGHLIDNMEIRKELLMKAYYIIIIPAVVPFLFLEERPKKLENKDYIIEVLLGDETYKIFKDVFKFALASIISSLYLKYVISKFKIDNINEMFLWWSSYLLILVAISKLLSLLFSILVIKNMNISRLIEFEDLKRISFGFILIVAIISPIKSLMFNSLNMNISLYLIIGVITLSTIMCFESIVMNIIFSSKVNNLDNLNHEQRISIDLGNPYIELAVINSKSYLVFITIITIFTHMINTVVKNSMLMNDLLQLIIIIAIPTFLIDKLTEKQLNVLVNLRASLCKYIISLEAIFFGISISIVSLSTAISAFIGDVTFFELMKVLDYKSYIYSIFIVINIAVIFRMLIGRNLDTFMKSLIVCISSILSYIIIPVLVSQLRFKFWYSIIAAKVIIAIGIFCMKTIIVKRYELN